VPVRCLSAIVAVLLATTLSAQDIPRQPEPGPVLNELVVQGASIYTRDDVMWVLGLSLGGRLAGSPAEVAEKLRLLYEREGYTAARVEPLFDAASGRLTLTVQEGRIDDIEVVGVPEDLARSFKEGLAGHDVRPGQIYNQRAVWTAVERLLDAAGGALRVGRSQGSDPDAVELVDRAGRHVLVIPLHRERGHVSLTSGTGAREDLFSPVDGFSPVIGFEGVAFDRTGFGHTFVGGYVSYKFGRDHTGFSLGIERPLLDKARLFVGAEAHDLTASDDLWRLSTAEQSLVAIGFKNTFRDYYRRRGTQVHAGIRPDPNQELVASWRWDRHEPLQNGTNFSFFRDSQTFRPNAETAEGDLHAVVLAYTYDSRGVGGTRPAAAFERHLVDDPFRGTRWQAYGWRVDWTSEIAGRATGGDYTFDRHILHARAYVPLLPRQSIAARVIAGFSHGELPLERRFAIGGVGTVHGYAFKEAAGGRMTLLNAEYRLDLTGDWRSSRRGFLRALFFFDVGRVDRPVAPSTADWLTGIGAGLQTGPFRLEFGYRANAIPRSRQVLLRLGPTF
jgi:outer membrane protein assembly factor BamA